MQLRDSTAAEEELFPNKRGCVLGREGVIVHEKEDSGWEADEWKYTPCVLKGKSVSTLAKASVIGG